MEPLDLDYPMENADWVKRTPDTYEALGIDDDEEPRTENCGTGAGGFQPGNTCARGGGGGYEQSMRGEFWLQDSFAVDAENDLNHEGWAIQAAAQEVLNTIDFDNSDLADLAADEANAEYPNLDLVIQRAEELEIDFDEVARKSGIPEETLQVAQGIGNIDPRVWAADKYDWVRLAGNDMQMVGITSGKMKTISSGLYDAFGEQSEGQSFNLEVIDPDTIADYYAGKRQRLAVQLYDDVPIDVLDGGDVRELRDYRGRRIERRFEPRIENCGTGSGGFQPGNTCAKGGESSESGTDSKLPEWAVGDDLAIDLEALEYPEDDVTDEDFKAILDHYGFEPVIFFDEHIDDLYIDGEQNVVSYDGEGYLSREDADEAVYGADITNALGRYEERFSEEFWSGPGPVYHATPSENVDAILEEGLRTGYGSGLTNRGQDGVYTTASWDEAILGTYGDAIIEIDTAAMKADGFTPFVEMEPDILEGDLRQALAHAMGNDRFVYDYDSSMSHNTIVITDAIPPKYLKRAH